MSVRILGCVNWDHSMSPQRTSKPGFVTCKMAKTTILMRRGKRRQQLIFAECFQSRDLFEAFCLMSVLCYIPVIKS
jgi:hypothetical protein